MPRPPKKKTRVLAKAQRLGELQAENEFNANTWSNKKQRNNWIRRQVEIVIEKLDPMELVATLGVTYIIKTGVDWSGEVLKEVAKGEIFMQFPAPFGTVASFVLPAVHELLGMDVDQIEEKVRTDPMIEVMKWVLSFAIAYLIVHNFGSLVESASSVISTANIMLGIGAIG